MSFRELHKKAVKISKEYLKLETELLEIVIQIEKSKAFIKLGHPSLFSYVSKGLGLSPSMTYALISVARKSIHVPELKKEIVRGNLSVNKAQRIVPVLNSKNKNEWIKVAKAKTHRQLEREVSLASPFKAIKERAAYVSKPVEEKVKSKQARLKLEMGLSERVMLKLRRAQDLESSRCKSHQSLEETLESVLDLYLFKKDPVKKAKRSKAKGVIKARSSMREAKESENSARAESDFKQKKPYSKQETKQQAPQIQKPSVVKQLKYKRKPIKSETYHKVNLRDQGRCRYTDSSGKRCSSRRHLEIHHIKPVSEGGDNSLENLITLCSGHHRMAHLNNP